MERLWNLVNSLLWILAIVVIGHGLTQRYSIGIDDQKELCLEGEHRWYLIDHWDRSKGFRVRPSIRRKMPFESIRQILEEAFHS
jgi:hypothetical protein